MVLTTFGLNAFAEPGPLTEEASTFMAGLPELEQFEWSAEPSPYTAQPWAQLGCWQEHTSLPGPKLSEDLQDYAGDAPGPGTESVLVDKTNAPGDPQLLVTLASGV